MPQAWQAYQRMGDLEKMTQGEIEARGRAEARGGKEEEIGGREEEAAGRDETSRGRSAESQL